MGTPTLHYDIAIIGAGPGGYSTALRAAQLNMSVAIIERDEHLGGTCLHRGCIPSKSLISATRIIEQAQRGADLGIFEHLDTIDFAKLRDYKNNVVHQLTTGLENLIRTRKITVFRGNARLVDTHICVDPSYGLHEVLQDGHSIGEHVIIEANDTVLATGSRPQELECSPFKGALINSTQALSLNTLPHSAIIIGSGATALEFASMWNAAGCKITLLIRKNNVLSHSDRRAALTLHRELERHGITIITGSRVTRVDTGNNLGATVHYQLEDSEDEHSVNAEIALAAIGITPNTDEAWFESIECDDRGYVITDAYGRTNRSHVWALGDITVGHALAHRAFAQGIVIAQTIAGIETEPVNEDNIPSIVFTSPEFATVGMTYAQAKQDTRFTNVKETIFPVMANPRMLMSGSGGSFSIVSGQEANSEPIVLGAHIVAPDSSDLIAELQQIVGNRIALTDAASLIHPHPTFSEIIGETLLKADNRPLNIR